MMDEHRWDPQGFDDDAVNGADVDAVRATDRLLDAIAAGREPDSADPLLRLLADARAETDRVIPATPDVSGDAPVHSLTGHRRRRTMWRAGGIAALGGISLTSLLVGSGVAAALVVGGFTAGALITGNSGGSGNSDSVVAESAEGGGEGSVGPSGSSAAGTSEESVAGTSAPGGDGAPQNSEDGHGLLNEDGGMVLADPQSDEAQDPVEPTDTTGDGSSDSEGGSEGEDGAASEGAVETPVPGGPMVMAEPQRGAAASPSKSSTSSTTPSSSPKAQSDPRGTEPSE